MKGIDAAIAERRVASYDGTEIAYYVAGRGEGLLVLAPGLGTPLIAWKYIIEALQDRYTILTWDPRGTYRSAVPRDPSHLRLEDQVRDLWAICDREGYERFLLGGWSMGVQISLEFYHQFPERVRALILLNGAYEHVLSTAFDLPAADLAFRLLAEVGRRLSPLVQPFSSRVLAADSVIAVLRRLGLVADNVELFSQMVKAFGANDLGVYLQAMLLLNAHSAAPYLSEVRVPTLITAGTKDRMTPVHTAEEMHRAIAGSELFVVPNGTHYTIAEYPEIVNLRLERFLRTLDPGLFGTSS